MKYEIVHPAVDRWVVKRDNRPIVGSTFGRGVTEAEANIIAFALNAVADGYSLYWCARTNDVLTPYNGPTEGVAPDA